MPLRLPFAALAIAVSCSAFATQLTLLSGPAYNVSGNGRYVLAGNYRVDVTNGALFTFPSTKPFWGSPRLITEDGKMIVVEVITGELGETQIYKIHENGSFTPLSNDGGFNASPYDVSANGSVVIGEIQGGPGPFQAYRWENGPPVSYGDFLSVISGDGQTIFGESWGTSVYWFQGSEVPMGEDGWDTPRVTDTTFNGQMAVGYYGHNGFLWLKGIGFSNLGHFPGVPGNVVPTSLSPDGSMIVGSEIRGADHYPFVYRASTGMVPLENYLASRGVSIAHWNFQQVQISNNGEALIGRGTYKGNPRSFHVWIAGNHLTIGTPDNVVRAGQTITATVSFATASPQARVVNLTAPADLVVPATVTVPAGAENVTFPVQIKSTAAAGKLSVSADHGGTLQAGFDLSVVEPIHSVSLAATRIHGGKYTRCTVTLQKPLRQTTQFIPQQVNGITMPAAINVPAGASSFSFNAVSPGIQVEALQTFAIRVSSPYHQERQATLQVFPPIGWMTVYPLEIKGGRTGLGRIGTTLAASTGGLRYSLRSLSSLMSVPSQVSIPEGGTQCQFEVTTLPVSTRAVRSIEARTALTVKTVSVTLVP